MPPGRDQIFEVIKSNVCKVLFDIDPAIVSPEKKLADLGANSVDRVEITMYSMEELGLKIPRVELHGVENLQCLVELFYKRLNP